MEIDFKFGKKCNKTFYSGSGSCSFKYIVQISITGLGSKKKTDLLRVSSKSLREIYEKLRKFVRKAENLMQNLRENWENQVLVLPLANI